MTLATLMVLLVRNVTFCDGFGIPATLRSQLMMAPFSVEGFDLSNGIIQFLRNGTPLRKMKVESWEVANGTVKLITPTGKWCLLRCPAEESDMKKFHLTHNLYMALFAVYKEPIYFADATIGCKEAHEVENEVVEQLLEHGESKFMVSDKDGNWAEEIIVNAAEEEIISVTKRWWDDGYAYERYNILEGMVVAH